MAHRDGLTPTNTVDKNGRWTTVYRKLFGSKSSQSKQPLPAPSLLSPTPVFDREASLQRIEKDALSALAARSESYRSHIVMSAIRKYPDDLLQRLEEAKNEGRQNFWMISAMIGTGRKHSHVSECLHFLPQMGQVIQSTGELLVRSLHRYRQLPESEDYSRESAEVRNQCAALIAVSKSVLYGLGDPEMFTEDEFNGERLFVLKDAALVDLVLEHHERASDIAEIISERGAADPEMIWEMLFAETAVLREGML